MVSGSQRYRIAIGPHQVVTISLPIRSYVHGRDCIYHLVIEPNAIRGPMTISTAMATTA